MKIPARPAIAYYVSAHGYGHGVRSCGIIRALNRLYPEIGVEVVSALPPDFLFSQIDASKNSLRPGSFDIGMKQIDSIRVDVPATLDAVRRLCSRRSEEVESEAERLRRRGIGLVVADIPALPIEAAARAGIPRLAVGNFSWDWIYEEFIAQDAAWGPVTEVFREQYAQTDLLLRLPFCDAMRAFRRVEDIPLVASPGLARRPEIAAATGAMPGKKWVLLSFTSLEWTEDALDRVERLREYEFFTVRPLEWSRQNVHPLNRRRMDFSDIVASVDAVISKPGFGILSDCIANGKPLIYADRSDFREYPVLVNAVRRFLRHVHIPAGELYRGDLAESLNLIWDRPEPGESCPLGGERVAAGRIARMLADARVRGRKSRSGAHGPRAVRSRRRR